MSRVLKSLVVLGALLLVTGSVARAQPASVTVDTKDHLTAGNGGVVVTGEIVCSSSETFTVQTIVSQNHAGIDTAAAGSSGPTQCLGVSQPFSVLATVLLPANGELNGGKATLLLFAGTNPGGGSTTLTASVNLVN